jgi:dihydrofolate reductase
MSKVILFNMITVDGYFEGSNGSIDWHHVDEEFNEFAIDQLKSAGGLIFGRKTYGVMASYWPTPAAVQDDPIVAGLMNSIPKMVFSQTLDHVDWNNTRLVTGDSFQEISRLKEQPGRDWFIFGSGDLAAALTQQCLIDEYRLMVNPVILGAGRPLFKDLESPLNLELVNTRSFHNGNVLLVYRLPESA